MTEWKKVKLGDVVTKLGDGIHGTPKYTQNGEYAFINGNNLYNNRIVIKSDTKRVNGHEFLKYKKELTERTLFVSINGTIGNVAKYNNEKIILGKSACYLNVDKNYNKEFVFYILKSPMFQQYIETYATGTTIKNVSLKLMRDYEFLLPPLPTQKKIAEVLSCLDAKIELNRRINENLEQQAQAIFKEWFVDNAKPEWKVGKLEDYVTIKRGGSPRPIQNYLTETGLRWLKISDVTSLNTPFIFNIAEHIKEEGLNKTVFLKSGSLVLSNSATPGIPKILAVDSCIHDGWLYFTDSKFSNEFLYLLFQHARPDFLSKGNGSIFINLKTDIVKAYQFPIPDDETLEKFQRIVGALFGEMYQVTAENLKLAEIRDTLLPKLMNGEIIL